MPPFLIIPPLQLRTSCFTLLHMSLVHTMAEAAATATANIVRRSMIGSLIVFVIYQQSRIPM